MSRPPDSSKNKPNPVGAALRAAGFVPLPRLWVRPEELTLIRKIAFQNEAAVNEIRRQVREGEIRP